MTTVAQVQRAMGQGANMEVSSSIPETSVSILPELCPIQQKKLRSAHLIQPQTSTCLSLIPATLQPPPPKVAPSVLPSKDLLSWAAIKDDPQKEPMVSGFLPPIWSSTFSFSPPQPATSCPLLSSHQNIFRESSYWVEMIDNSVHFYAFL